MQPDKQISQKVLATYGKQASSCYTCSSCVTACPVGRATGALRPVRILRLALLGQWDELLASPEIWFCLQCGICGRDCPMTAAPWRLIDDLRTQAAFLGAVPAPALERYAFLRAGLGRVRWRLAAACLDGREPAPSAAQMDSWAERPVAAAAGPLRLGPGGPLPADLARAFEETGVRRCFTCGECEGICPAGRERGVFDPKSLFRLVLMGHLDEVLTSPSLWLCLQCGRCTGHCPQGVRGHTMLARLREMALARGMVDPAFNERWRAADRQAFAWYVDRVAAAVAPGQRRAHAA